MIKTNSCSSKVLIAGGYSILFEGSKGLVLSTSACYTSTSEITPIDQSNNQLLGKVEIESKGFNAKWIYNISLNNDSKHLIIEPEDKQASKNVFLDAVLRTGLSFSYNQLAAQPFNLKISISNDNAFYSIEEHEGKTVFKKSGLGSSACLITTVLASILDSFNSISRTDKKDLGILHILCQVANSIAQNKIGSGFDISAAIFGNQVYSRFPVKEVETLVDALGNDKDSSVFNELVLNTLKESPFEWLIPSQLIFPQSLKLWLIDLETGSDTRSLVKEILKYLDSSPQWKEYFFEVANKVVQGMYDIFQEINSFEKQGEANAEKLAPLYGKLKSLSTEYRELLKDLGNNAKVEVEPDLLTYVLDELTSLNKDLIYAVCPGAGGYDAACLISTQDLSQEDLDKALQKVNSDIKEKGLFPNFADLKRKILPIQSYPDANIKFY